MRRRAPRPLATALDAMTREARPATPLASVQAVWSDVAGARLAREAAPAFERAGTVTVACRSAAWASELTLLAPDLTRRLNEALGRAGAAPVAALRFRTGPAPGVHRARRS